MSIELKEAAQQVLKELGEARKIVRASSSRQLAKDWDRRATDALANLRTAIQQAEAQRPATGEPVHQIRKAFTQDAEWAWRDATEALFHMHPKEHRRILYTHPAPSVPDVAFELQELREIERAMDDFADCGETDVVDALLLRAVQAGFLECTHFHVANRGALQEAIDAAMLAAKDTK